MKLYLFQAASPSGRQHARAKVYLFLLEAPSQSPSTIDILVGAATGSSALGDVAASMLNFEVNDGAHPYDLSAGTVEAAYALPVPSSSRC